MTVNRTTLLDLPLPVTGTESGTWGDTTNNGLSQYMDIAIAGMNSLTSANFTAGALTLANTLGDSSATNIAAGSAQYATIKVSSLAVNSTITAPGSNRSYRIINADATYSLTIKASGQTGVTFLPGQTGVVAFNGTDYVIVGVVGAGTATDNAVARFDGTTGKLVQNSVVTIADSTGDISGVGQLNATTVDATNIEVTNIKAKDGTAAASIADSTGVVSITANPVLSGGTANGVLYLNGSKVATSGSALTFDGTNFATTGSINAGNAKFLAFSASAPSSSNFALYGDTSTTVLNGPSGGVVQFNIANSEAMRLTSTGLGIGTSSPAAKLHVNGNVYLGGAARNIYADNGSGIFFNGLNNFGSGIYSDGSGTALKFQTLSADRLTLDSSGNLGLGVTPSAWASDRKALQVNLASLVGGNNNNFAVFGNNVHYDGAVKYIATAAASQYIQNTAGDHLWYNAPSGTAGNAISFTQAMTLTSGGALLVGQTAIKTSEVVRVGAGVQSSILLDNSGNTNGAIVGAYNDAALLGVNRNPSTGVVYDATKLASDIALIGSSTDSYIAFETATAVNTAPTERARITSGGDLLVGTTSAFSGTSFYQAASGIYTSYFRQANASNPLGLLVNYSASAPNGTGNAFFEGNDNVAARVVLRSNGGIANYQANDVNLSDRREKTNFAPAKSYLDTICAIPVQTFNYIDQSEDDPGLTLGVVAQDVQAVAPELVSESNWGTEDNPKMRLSIYQTDLQYALMKCIQEQQALITSLTARVALLEGN